MERVHYRIEAATGERVACGAEEADLVSSLCADGRHAPVFDIDHRATLAEEPDGARLLHVNADVQEFGLGYFLGRLASMGMIDTVMPKGLFDHAFFPDGVTPMPDVRLVVPASLRPSYSEGHFHLLLDFPMDWSDYRELLVAAKSCGLIAESYLRLCERHGKGFLWMPGAKPDGLRRLELGRLHAEDATRKRREDAGFQSWVDDYYQL